MELKGSQSWKNMETALNAEALAYVQYTFYGQQARKDGYVQISGDNCGGFIATVWRWAQ